MPESAPPLLAVEHCPSCHSRRREVVQAEHGGIALVRCLECGLVHATAGYAPRFLDEHYADRAQRAPASTPDDPGSPAPGTVRPQSERKRQSLLLYDRLCGGQLCPSPSGALALDIGCGVGLLLDLLREQGYRTTGIERSDAGAQAQQAGHRIYSLDIEGEVTLPERFSLITLTHVLEHLRRPEDALRWIGAHLRPDGFAIVEVPNWGDLARPLWGPRYRPLELGDHLSFFERHTLAPLCERAGLRLHTLWSAAQARTLVFPSLLSGLDVGLSAVRRLRGGSQRVTDEQGVGVAASRTTAGTARWRHALVTATLAGLDRLDPLLDRFLGSNFGHGANLVAVLRHRTTPSE